MDIKEAEKELSDLEKMFLILPDTPETYQEWRKLVITYKVKGVNVHDARLVAIMLVHNLTHILTFNSRDFMRFPEITVINPTDFNNF